MIDLIAGYARGYTANQIRPFLYSLKKTGYSGQVLLFADGGAAHEAQRLGFPSVPIPKPRIKVHSDRFIQLEEALRNLPCQGVFLTDTRDVIFQKDPATLPSEGLNAYEEDAGMTIGTCPYNAEWIRLGYGMDVFQEMKHFPISCVGTVSGDQRSIKAYLQRLRSEVEAIQPLTRKPQDQAAHNYIIRRVLPATVYPNDLADVFTVGYVPRGTVRIKDGQIINQHGMVPAVVHQWDRHSNLKAHVEGMK